jgi:hypothetical protein
MPERELLACSHFCLTGGCSRAVTTAVPVQSQLRVTSARHVAVGVQSGRRGVCSRKCLTCNCWRSVAKAGTFGGFLHMLRRGLCSYICLTCYCWRAVTRSRLVTFGVQSLSPDFCLTGRCWPAFTTAEPLQSLLPDL